MFWGKRAKHSGVSPGKMVSSHLGDWEELAVDYVDGTLDQATAAAIREHLAGCTACAFRLESQQAALAFLRGTPLVDAPAELEEETLGEALFPREPQQSPRRTAWWEPSRRSALSRWSLVWRSRIRPWIPATVAVVAILAVVVTFGVLRQGAGLSDTTETTTVAAGAATSEMAAPEALEADDSATGRSETTVAVALGGTGASTTVTELALGTANYATESATLQPSGPYLQDRDDMADALATASAPAYFFYDGQGGSLLATEQAEAITVQVTEVTGLQLLDQTLSCSTRAFAAFLPREDATALVDLLRSIGASLQLTVSLSLEPGPAVTAWAESLLEDRSALAELDASRTSPPAVTRWSFTTSTSPPTTEAEGEQSSAVQLNEAGTHVLVVILMNIQR
jgi:anti-sigma factor RsiW